MAGGGDFCEGCKALAVFVVNTKAKPNCNSLHREVRQEGFQEQLKRTKPNTWHDRIKETAT